MGYRYVVDQNTDEVVERIPSRELRSLRDFFRYLAANPSTPGDQQVVDAAGRPNQVKRHGRLVITYWPDHAARELRIVAIEYF